MARLVLIGLPGTGKSSLARTLAGTWGCESLDTDDLVAANVGMTSAQFLREYGEASFRVKELGALREAVLVDVVVATGSGVVSTSGARRVLMRERTVWLDADNATLLERVADGDRPLLGEDHAGVLAELRARRQEWYRSCSRIHLDASGSLNDVTLRLLEQLTGSPT